MLKDRIHQIAGEHHRIANSELICTCTEVERAARQSIATANTRYSISRNEHVEEGALRNQGTLVMHVLVLTTAVTRFAITGEEKSFIRYKYGHVIDIHCGPSVW